LLSLEGYRSDAGAALDILEDMTADELNYSIDSVKAAFIRNGWATAE
jgi:hypothetical protein